MTKYFASHVANFFLERAAQENMPITQMKLMKLVYIGYGWVYAILDEKLFEESIQAWQHGPVIKSVYNEFKHHGSNAITSHAVEFDLETLTMSTPKISKKDSDILVILEKVWEVYKHFSASALREKTHEQGTPWKNVFQHDIHNIDIKNEEIKSHFVEKITHYLDA